MNFLYFFLSKNFKKTRLFVNEFNFRKNYIWFVLIFWFVIVDSVLQNMAFLNFAKLKAIIFAIFSDRPNIAGISVV